MDLGWRGDQIGVDVTSRISYLEVEGFVLD